MDAASNFLPAGAAARAALLRLARSEQTKGLIYEAIHTYKHLLDQYPSTEESREAADELVRLAQFLEQEGKYHSAKSLYLQLEGLA